MDSIKIHQGMKLLISKQKNGEETRQSHGFDDGMRRMIGTVQTVASVEGDVVIFLDSRYYWHPGDLQLVSSIPEVTLTGEKHQFDVAELS